MSIRETFVESGIAPEFLIRAAIRNLVRKRLEGERARRTSNENFAHSLRTAPVAVETDAANEQHYEVPPEFFKLALGQHLKYSSCYFPEGIETLDDAETAMLKLTCERAGIKDGMEVLELGCGWGSLTLWMAEHFPNSKITGVSNSAPQRETIMKLAKARGLQNIKIVTADVNDFRPSQTFDRIVSIEMFEHMRNPEVLFNRISEWLKESGKLFVHVFCHKEFPYLFETEGTANWMGRYFFTGGMMPSRDLYKTLEHPLKLEKQWDVNGVHYAKTAEAWNTNMHKNKDAILSHFSECYGKKNAKLWHQRWRIFFLACAELFAWDNGNQWFVSHYRFSK